MSPLCGLLFVCLSVLSVRPVCQPLKPQKKKLKTNLRKGTDLGSYIRHGAVLHPCIRLCFSYQIPDLDFFIFKDNDIIGG